ncbi:tRNA pseudouridine synthase B [Motilibacter rhizosphaerae]|uniref:tRNA pseudouridine synthase B n=1 Tax=Motilibacter rhizosphaerae TaxID=598652 RepID=A0A4Q7NQS9_9ACTN|nr:tRNA pseudouridine(55) synthase TruB [Motilibacter rhizosphaerae]RZS86950.1 tRNA pseudouridine synthase B [Motilibacter rhizosphaerae]
MNDGLLVVDKPAGWTSHDVVARVRRLARTRRVGHAGTLDPMATGVLVLGIGRATRLLGHVAAGDKAYTATVRLGAATTTDDAEGEEVSRAPAAHLTLDEVRAAALPLTGEIAQVPSTVSAIKVDGERAYAVARSGREVALAARPVTVAEFALSDPRVVGEYLDLEASVVCSSGTYVRALARDLGAALGVGGHLTALRRTRVGPWTLDAARTLEQLEEELVVLPLADAVARAFPRRDVDAGAAARVRVGARLPVAGLPSPYGVFGPGGEVLALAEERDGRSAYLAVFAAQG